MFTLALSGCVDGLVPGAESLESDSSSGHEMGDVHADSGAEAGHSGSSGHGADGHDAQTGMNRPGFQEGEGTVPSEDDARQLPQLSRIRIIGDEGFTPSNGVRSGNGTMADPYIISGWYVTGDFTIQDTDACVVVRENYVGGQLSLNWNGQCVHTHHNFVRDLRVNENIRRIGYATGGYIEHNLMEIVGQLRHYDGVFRANTVGPGDQSSLWDEVLETVPYDFVRDPRVANIDGFNQGIIEGNTFYGSVDLDLHGHHHGTGFFAPHSHYHGDDEARKMAHDHTMRWTSVSFTGNTIIDPEGYGLRFDDQNHAGDDRVANSEQEETLDLVHVHHESLEIIGNTVEGAGIWIDVLGAEDRSHDRENFISMMVSDNTITLVERDPGPFGIFGMYASHVGIQVQTAKDMDLSISNNKLTAVAADKSDDPTGGWMGILQPSFPFTAIDLSRMSDGGIKVLNNVATGFQVGVEADRFERVTWQLTGNDFADAREISSDDSVPVPQR